MDSRTQKPKKTALILAEVRGERSERTVASALVDPTVTAGNTLNRLNGNHESDINAIVAELRTQANAVNTGNLARSEAMLLSQATTLDTLFHTLMGWALNHARKGGNDA